MACCLPFLYKPNTVEVPSPSPQAIEAVQAVQAVQAVEAVQEIPEKEVLEEDPTCMIEDVPQVLRLRFPLRIPDVLMDIRNPKIKSQFKEFCKENKLCVACSYASPNKPTVLVYNGVLYECPRCDSDVDSP